MKGELEELGEEVDDSVDSISKVQTQILNLTHGAVNIFDDNDQFKSYYDIMEEISNVFDKLSSTEQAPLSEILFGKNRGNQGAALIQAFQSGQVQKAYETAINSAGSAQQEQDRWLDSLDAKLNQLSASYQNLSKDILDSNLAKGVVDTGRTAINVIDQIVKGLDSIGMILPTIIGMVGGGFLQKNGLGKRTRTFSGERAVPTLLRLHNNAM